MVKAHVVLLGLSLSLGCVVGGESDGLEGDELPPEAPIDEPLPDEIPADALPSADEPPADDVPTASDSLRVGQHQNGAVGQRWNLNGAAAWNLDQLVYIEATSENMYYAHQFNMSAGGTSYMGLQNSNGTHQAIFSVWNATQAKPGPGATCVNFGGEGVGKSCRIKYNWAQSTWYKLRVWRLGSEGNQFWWGGWIIDPSGNETYLGAILAPGGVDAITSSVSFNEYYGDRRACDDVPRSVAWFLSPYINQANYAAYGSTYILPCSEGRVTPTIYGVSYTGLGL